MKHIVNYLIYLRTQCNLNVSLYFSQELPYVISKHLSVFYNHDFSYCVHLKSCVAAYEHCVCKREAVLKKAWHGTYCGTCHAGVKEYVYPIWYQKDLIGFASVSGYQTEKSDEYLRSISKKYDLNLEELKLQYAKLKKEFPEKSYVDTLLYPLCDILELRLLRHADSPQHEPVFAELIDQYLSAHHTEQITSDKICQVFHCNRTYLSQQFNLHYRKTIRERLTEFRISDAKKLLLYSDLSVTEIALTVGYTDSNYFSMLFKKETGYSPLTYRKTFR